MRACAVIEENASETEGREAPDESSMCCDREGRV